MDLEETTFDSNKELLENFARDLRITETELKNHLKLAARHEKLIKMAEQVNTVFKQNPNAHINFGDYGANLARELNIEQDAMYQAILVSAYNDLLLSMVKQLNLIYNQTNE